MMPYIFCKKRDDPTRDMWFRWKMSGGVPGVSVGRISNNLFLVGLYGFRSSSVVDFRFFCRFMKIWWRFCKVIKLNQFGKKNLDCLNQFGCRGRHFSTFQKPRLQDVVGGSGRICRWWTWRLVSSMVPWLSDVVKNVVVFFNGNASFFFGGRAGSETAQKKGTPFRQIFFFVWHGFCKMSWVVLFVFFLFRRIWSNFKSIHPSCNGCFC